MPDHVPLRVRVATYNVLDPGFGTGEPWDARRNNVAKTIVGSGAAIVCLQEAGFTPLARRLGIPADLAELTGMRLTASADNGVTFLYDPAAWQPGGHGSFLLSRSRGDHRRSAVWQVFVHEDGTRMLVVGTHLTYVPGNHRARARQARVVASRVRRLNRVGLPVIVLGDFNSWVARAGVTPVSVFARAGLREALADGIARLDHIVVSPTIEVERAGVEDPVLSGTASDHHLVWADLLVRVGVPHDR